MDNYPVGANNSSAPWNQFELPEEEIEVTAFITLRKTLKVKVNDYKIETGEDEDGTFTYVDFSPCDLYKAVEEQVTLPQDLALFTRRIFDNDLDLKAAGMPKYLKDAISDCSNWSIDEFEVCKE